MATTRERHMVERASLKQKPHPEQRMLARRQNTAKVLHSRESDSVKHSVGIQKVDALKDVG